MKLPFPPIKSKSASKQAAHMAFADEKQALWKSSARKLTALAVVAGVTELTCYATAICTTLAVTKRMKWAVPATTGIIAAAGIASTAVLATRAVRSIETIDAFEYTLIETCENAEA